MRNRLFLVGEYLFSVYLNYRVARLQLTWYWLALNSGALSLVSATLMTSSAVLVLAAPSPPPSATSTVRWCTSRLSRSNLHQPITAQHCRQVACDWLPPEVCVVVELDQAGGGVEAEVLADAALETREAETQVRVN